MKEEESELARFFAWARPRVYNELDARLKNDPSLDPNWTFSDIMQELLVEYRQSIANDIEKGQSNVDSEM
jgi:hypothetical protein